jgi:small-conductance mechanosensitive channel
MIAGFRHWRRGCGIEARRVSARSGLLLSWMAIVLVSVCGLAANASGQEAGEGAAGMSPPGQNASVIVDGRILFNVAGVPAYPAERRAREITRRIYALAEDTDVDPDSLTLDPTSTEDAIIVLSPHGTLLHVLDIDSRQQGLNITRGTAASVAVTRIQEAIADYREDRRPEVLLRNAGYSLVLTLVAVGVFFGGRFAFNRFSGWVERRIPERLEAVEQKSFSLIQAQQLWRIFRGTVRVLGLVIAAVLAYGYINAVLGLFPWTRLLATYLFDFIVDPMRHVASGIAGYLPNLMYLVIIILIFRYVLKLLHTLFGAINRKRIHFTGFEPEWAWPTYRLVRLLVIAFGVILAYPYIPGSDSAAFKGVSIFLGVLASIGSSSIISNIVAGYSMTYRRAFRVGDRVKIDDTVGDVTEMRLLVTHLRTPKNEEVVIPNSVILNNEVVNYSSQAKDRGLILHTTVGIGYEVPWRQVQAMLLEAAKRTRGIVTSRDPFVLRKALGDFAITYELNVYIDDAERMPALHSSLHDNILDVFNEYGVAIMTPAYEADPPDPKLVPRDQWYAAPAKDPAARTEPAPAGEPAKS